MWRPVFVLRSDEMDARSKGILATLGLAGVLGSVVWLRSGVPTRERRVARDFRAPRSSPREREKLNATMRHVLDRVAHERDASEAELVETLVDALNRDSIGIVGRREAAARAVVREVMNAAETFKGEHAGPSEMRRRALDQQATTLVRALHEETGHREAKSPSFGPRPDGTRRLLWGELSNIADEDGARLPDHVRALDEEQVAMAGYLVEGAFDELLLVKSVWGCCFGEPPAVDEAVVVTVEGPVLYPWFEGVVRVIGPIEVGPQYEDGQLLSIYRMRAIQVDTLQ